jgi:tetratricopeptide (TPR) repeat protein
MGATRSRRGLTALALLLACFLLSPGRAAPLLKDDEQALRDRALKLNEITGDDPILGQIVTMIEDKDNSKKLLAVALKMTKEKGKEQPFNINATFILARVAQRLGDIDTSDAFYQLNGAQALKLSSSQKYVRAFTSRIDMLFQAKRYAESEKVCKEFLETEGDDNLRRFKMLVLRRMVQTQAKQGKIKDALRVVDNLIKVDPDNWLTLHLKAWVQREAGRYEEAAKTYEDVIARIQKDENVKEKDKADFVDEIRYTLSGVYIDLNKIDKAAEQLQTLLKKDTKNPTYMNDLGFIWADHDMKLDEAEKLIRKALDEDRKQRRKAGVPRAEDRDNAAYLDSLGWVLFKQKKFKEALEPLLEAVKQDEGQHIEIYDHLADVHVALGQKEKALEAWKKGLSCPPVSKRDETRKTDVEKKMKELSTPEK